MQLTFCYSVCIEAIIIVQEQMQSLYIILGEQQGLSELVAVQ